MDRRGHRIATSELIDNKVASVARRQGGVFGNRHAQPAAIAAKIAAKLE